MLLQNVNNSNRRYRRSTSQNAMTSSKSAGNIVLDQYGNPISPRQSNNRNNFDQSKRAKSEYMGQKADDFQQQYLASFRKAQAKENQAFLTPKQQHRHRPQSAGKSSNSSSGGGLTPRRATPRTAVTPNDVFTPISEGSSDMNGKVGIIQNTGTGACSLYYYVVVLRVGYQSTIVQ